ncbi:uncharacterized protein BXZ73DRAFT_97623 [Epithele typhae]|uniref:uncharacterized protein n=1 Tax=Epithele typhae TaxID=378194 RepID=UPI0020077759|nr:uncharacterized protein BXZ73DRAFT_97623 [Epithele typhae]KAH9942203.1 hypothetical protein BXZ73DRAFT_97623 [Epithele typhae]
MFNRISQIAAILMMVSTIASASPAPIEAQLANVIAENRNSSCLGPDGCSGRPIVSPDDSVQSSGASFAFITSPSIIVVAVAAAGLL